MLNLIDTQPTRGSRGLAEQVYQHERLAVRSTVYINATVTITRHSMVTSLHPAHVFYYGAY